MWDPDGRHHDTMNNGYDMMNGGGGWMTGFAVLALMLLLVATVAVLANLFLHVRTKPGQAVPAGGSDTDARLVLDGRLARGEVSADEYQVVRALLEGA